MYLIVSAGRSIFHTCEKHIEVFIVEVLLPSHFFLLKKLRHFETRDVDKDRGALLNFFDLNYRRFCFQVKNEKDTY
jgi:hypothetical protein